jgi:hypothetical protein
LRLTALAGFGLVAIGYGVYAVSLAPLFLVLGTLIWTASEIIGAPTTFAYPGLVAPPHLRGRYSGAMLGVFGLGNAVGPVLGVAVWDQVGDQVWLWAAAVGVLSAVCARSGCGGREAARRRGGGGAGRLTARCRRPGRRTSGSTSRSTSRGGDAYRGRHNRDGGDGRVACPGARRRAGSPA